VRVVTATHHQLLEQVQSVKFRGDLFYRLTHFPPSAGRLRERGEDILLLAGEFVGQPAVFSERDPLSLVRTRAGNEQLAVMDFPWQRS